MGASTSNKNKDKFIFLKADVIGYLKTSIIYNLQKITGVSLLI